MIFLKILFDQIWTDILKGLTKSYWMHVLVLKFIAPESNYKLSKIAIKNQNLQRESWRMWNENEKLI